MTSKQSEELNARLEKSLDKLLTRSNAQGNVSGQAENESQSEVNSTQSKAIPVSDFEREKEIVNRTLAMFRNSQRIIADSQVLES
jgi:hypothetical protein